MSSSGRAGGGSALTNGYTAIHSWLCQETTGSSLVDQIGGNASPLACTGTFALAAGLLPGFATTANQSVQVNGGVGGIASPAQPAGMAAMGFVLAAWWKPIGSNAGNPIILTYGATSGIALQHLSTNNLQIVQPGGAAHGSIGQTVDSLWHRLALYVPPSGAAGTPLLFIDGLLVISGSAYTPVATAGDFLAVGCLTPGNNVALNTLFSRVKVIAATNTEDAKLIANTDYAGQVGVIPN